MMAGLRQLIDANGLADKYPYLGCYADWLLIPATNRAFVLLKQLTDAFVAHQQKQSESRGEACPTRWSRAWDSIGSAKSCWLCRFSLTSATRLRIHGKPICHDALEGGDLIAPPGVLAK
jgi:hypothetical protein